jgi:hypothetical protein
MLIDLPMASSSARSARLGARHGAPERCTDPTIDDAAVDISFHREDGRQFAPAFQQRDEEVTVSSPPK